MNGYFKISYKTLTLIGIMLSPFLMGALRLVGYLGLAIMFTGLLIAARRISFDSLSKLACAYIILLTMRFIYQTISGQMYPDTTRSFILQIMTFGFIVLARAGEYTFDDWKKMLDRATDFFILIGIYLFLTRGLVASSLFGSMYGNVLIVVMGVKLLDVVYEKNTWRIVKLLLSFVLLYFTEMRSALVGAFIGLIYVFLPQTFIKKKRVNMALFVIVVSLCFLVPYIYLELYSPSTRFTANLSTTIQNFVALTTGKRFFSGRNEIWPYILTALKGKQFLGGGIGLNPSQIYDTTHSAHNLFLFIRCEQGFLGLGIFVLLLYHVWKEYTLQESKYITVSAQAFFLAVMIQQTFSLGLLGGKGAFSFISWAVLIACTKAEIHE